MKGTAVKQKQPLSLDDLGQVLDYYATSTQHNDLLFVAMLLTGFFALMCLDELTFPDDKSLCNWWKITHRESVVVNAQFHEFLITRLMLSSKAIISLYARINFDIILSTILSDILHLMIGSFLDVHCYGLLLETVLMRLKMRDMPVILSLSKGWGPRVTSRYLYIPIGSSQSTCDNGSY